MNWTTWTRRWPLMDENPGNGGEAGGGAAGGGEGNPPADTPAAPSDPAPSGEQKPADPAGEAKPVEPAVKPRTAAADLLGDGTDGAKPAGSDARQYTDEDYTKSFEGLDERTRAEAGGFLAEFREAGVAPETAARLAKAWTARQAAETERFEAETAEKAKALLETWGEREKGDVRSAMRQYVPNGSYLQRLMTETPVGNDPDVLNLLRVAGSTLRADNAAGAGAKGAGGAAVPLSRQLGIDL